MIIQHVIKGISGLKPAQAQQILDEGIKCNWWLNYSPLKWDEVPAQLSDANLDNHQNHYGDSHKFQSRTEPFSKHTPFISTTAGTVQRDAYLYTNTRTPAWQIALRFATDKWKSDGYLFYCYVFILGKKAVAQQPFAEELRELHVYTDYSSYQHEGELTAKILIPPAQIERAEYWSLSNAKAADSAKVLSTPSLTLTNKHYVPPEELNNVRKYLE